MSRIPEKTIAYNVYLDSAELLGLADVELPSPEQLSETVSGAGISGEYESPTLGHTKSMSCKRKFRSKTSSYYKLLAPRAHELDLRASVQIHDSATGQIVSDPERILVRGVPKRPTLGKWETGKAQDADMELEVLYLKVIQGGEEVLEIDKLNYVYRVGGTDYLASVRTDLGKEG